MQSSGYSALELGPADAEVKERAEVGYSAVNVEPPSAEDAKDTQPDLPLKGGPWKSLLFTYGSSQLDQMLDGNVILELIKDGWYASATILYLIVLVPQLLVWAFLKVHNKTGWGALVRIASCPIIGVASTVMLLLTVHHASRVKAAAWWLNITVRLACISLEPLWMLILSLKEGKQSDSVIWHSIGEGLLEGACSGSFTLYMLLLHGKTQSFVFLASITVSLFSITKAGVALFYFGEPKKSDETPICVYGCFGQPKASTLKKLLFALLVMLPRVTSRIFMVGIVAFLTRPSNNLDTAEDLKQNKAWIIMAFLIFELTSNIELLIVLNPKISKVVACFFAVGMIFAGPPDIISSFKRYWFAHAGRQFVYTVCMATVAMTVSPLNSKHWVDLVADHKVFIILWGITCPWAFITSWILSAYPEWFGSAARRRANLQLADAAKEKDVVLAHLLVSVEEADKQVLFDSNLADIGESGPETPYMRMMSTIPKPRRAQLDGKWHEDLGGYVGGFEYDSKLYFAPATTLTTGILVVDIAAWLQQHPSQQSLLSASRQSLSRTSAGITAYLVPPFPEWTETWKKETGKRKGKDVEDWKKNHPSPTFTGVTGVDDTLFFSPGDADHVMTYQISSETFSKIELPDSFKALWGKTGGILHYGGFVYCCPDEGKDVLVINPKDKTCSTIPIPMEFTGDQKFQGMAEHDGKLYCAPLRASAVLVVDPAAGKCSSIPLPPSLQKVERKCNGIAAHSGKLYCAPYHASEILVVNPTTRTCSTISLPQTLRVEKDMPSKCSGIASDGLRLFCVPATNDDVLVCDPEAETFFRMPPLEPFDKYQQQKNKYGGIVVVAADGNKHLFCSPNEALNILVLKVDHLHNKEVEFLFDIDA